jgi:hypothetical protein
MTAPIGPEVPESFPEPSAAMMRIRENASDYLEHEVGVFATVLTDLSLVEAIVGDTLAEPDPAVRLKRRRVASHVRVGGETTARRATRGSDRVQLLLGRHSENGP